MPSKPRRKTLYLTPKINKMVQVLAKKSKKATAPISDKKMLESFRNVMDNGDKALIEGYNNLKDHIFELEDFDVKCKLQMLFVSGAYIDKKLLKTIRNSANVEVDENHRITKYEMNDVEYSSTHRRVSLKRRKSVVERIESDDSSEDDRESDEEIKKEEKTVDAFVTRRGRVAKKRTFYDATGDKIEKPAKMIKKKNKSKTPTSSKAPKKPVSAEQGSNNSQKNEESVADVVDTTPSSHNSDGDVSNDLAEEQSTSPQHSYQASYQYDPFLFTMKVEPRENTLKIKKSVSFAEDATLIEYYESSDDEKQEQPNEENVQELKDEALEESDENNNEEGEDEEIIDVVGEHDIGEVKNLLSSPAFNPSYKFDNEYEMSLGQKKSVSFSPRITVHPIPSRRMIMDSLTGENRDVQMTPVVPHHDLYDSGSDSEQERADDIFENEADSTLNSTLDPEEKRDELNKELEAIEKELEALDQTMNVEEILSIVQSLLRALDFPAHEGLLLKIDNEIEELHDTEKTVPIKKLEDALNQLYDIEEPTSSTMATISLKEMCLIIKVILITKDSPKFSKIERDVSSRLRQLKVSDKMIPVANIPAALDSVLEGIST
uniref:SPK domain-containing protein n=1 Tax=Caenorhabditis tropicalis TaxID=1561998 RepID=A0A1I7UB00_9PELO